MDIPIPLVSEGGIFDRLEGDELQRIEQSKRLINQLDSGVTGNYGGIVPLWMKYLLSANFADRVYRLTERFVTRVAPAASGYDERVAKKFAVPAIAGYLAAEGGVVPWPKNWPIIAAENCYLRALRAVHRDQDIANEKLQLLVKLTVSHERFIRVKIPSHDAVQMDKDALGVVTTYCNEKVVAIRDDRLIELAGGKSFAKLICSKLLDQGILLSGQGHAGTIQLPIAMRANGETVKKPRFWVMNHARLLNLNSTAK
jgi:hypothetical protein